MKQHVGVILEKAVRNSDISISELAKRLNVNRKTIYNWFGQPNIRMDVLQKVGSIISCEFSTNIPGNEEGMTYSKNNSTKNQEPDPMAAADYWKNKYLYLLEKYNDLIVKKQQAKYINSNAAFSHRERV